MNKEDQQNLDNHSRQLNSNDTDLSHNNDAYKAAQDNRSEQLNKNSSK